MFSEREGLKETQEHTQTPRLKTLTVVKEPGERL
jgi:hypothetical protein